MYGAEREEVSESWLHTYDLSSTMIPNISTAIEDEEHFCKLILYKEIKDSRYVMTYDHIWQDNTIGFDEFHFAFIFSEYEYGTLSF